jgi:hypothetical protein
VGCWSWEGGSYSVLVPRSRVLGLGIFGISGTTVVQGSGLSPSLLRSATAAATAQPLRELAPLLRLQLLPRTVTAESWPSLPLANPPLLHSNGPSNNGEVPDLACCWRCGLVLQYHVHTVRTLLPRTNSVSVPSQGSQTVPSCGTEARPQSPSPSQARKGVVPVRLQGPGQGQGPGLFNGLFWCLFLLSLPRPLSLLLGSLSFQRQTHKHKLSTSTSTSITTTTTTTTTALLSNQTPGILLEPVNSWPVSPLQASARPSMGHLAVLGLDVVGFLSPSALPFGSGAVSVVLVP